MSIDDPLVLVITRTLRVPRARVWQAWSDPALLQSWWCPQPWTTEVLAFELRAGGAFHTRMRGPDGDISDNPGSFLDVQHGERIVWTSSLLGSWQPAPEPWMPMTAFITLEDEGGHTRYRARVLHRDAASCQQHEQMGFFDGWNICISQLESCAAALR